MSITDNPLTVFLVDDHAVVRSGLRVLLESDNEFEVIGETGDGLEALRLLEKLNPQVMLPDLMITSLGGIEVTRQAVRISPQTRILIFSIHDNEAYVLEGLRADATGYSIND